MRKLLLTGPDMSNETLIQLQQRVDDGDTTENESKIGLGLKNLEKRFIQPYFGSSPTKKKESSHL
jgi:hypothetical protein